VLALLLTWKEQGPTNEECADIWRSIDITYYVSLHLPEASHKYERFVSEDVTQFGFGPPDYVPSRFGTHETVGHNK
jgi:hypothetical protein